LARFTLGRSSRALLLLLLLLLHETFGFCFCFGAPLCLFFLSGGGLCCSCHGFCFSLLCDCFFGRLGLCKTLSFGSLGLCSLSCCVLLPFSGFRLRLLDSACSCFSSSGSLPLRLDIRGSLLL